MRLSSRLGLLALLTMSLLATACSSQDRLMAELKKGDPQACRAPIVEQTLARLLRASAKANAGDTLTKDEMIQVDKAAPITLSNVTAEHADQSVGKLDCSGALIFQTASGQQSFASAFTVLPDLSEKSIAVRANNLEQAGTAYASNYTPARYAALTGHKSEAEQLALKDEQHQSVIHEAEADKAEHRPEFDESLIDPAKAYDVPYRMLDADTRQHFGWMRAHCKDPSDGRGITGWQLAGELGQNVRSIYLKLKAEHPELLTAADAKCFASEESSYRYAIQNEAQELKNLGHP